MAAMEGPKVPKLNLQTASRRNSSMRLGQAARAAAAVAEAGNVDGAGPDTARGLLADDAAPTVVETKELDVAAGPMETPRHNLAKHQSGTDVNKALFEAADEGHVPALREALESGGNPNWFNMKAEGQTALHRACLKKNLGCIDILLEKVGIENQENSGSFATVIDIRDAVNKNTPLHIAAAQGNLRLLNLLLDKGASPNSANALNNCPLHTAAVSNHVGCVRALISRGANISALNKRGSSALHFAVYGLQSTTGESTQITNLLLQNGVGVNVADRTGTTALHVAASHGFCKVATNLLEFGADVGVEDEKGRDPLYYAERKGASEMVFLLNSVERDEKPRKRDMHALMAEF